MEPGHGQDPVRSFSELQPFGTWESFSHGPLGGLTGTCVWTDPPPDGILAGNLHHPHYQHEPSGVVLSHYQSFSPVDPVRDPYSSISLPWVAVGAIHHGMMPGELHNAIAGIDPSESQVVAQCREEPTHSHNHVTKGEHIMLTNTCPPVPRLRTMEPAFNAGYALHLQSGTTQNLHDQRQVKGGVTWDAAGPRRRRRRNSTTKDSKSKKPCNCTKSQCLKRYCDCFANGEVCSDCNCVNCWNDVEHPTERHQAILNCLDHNPEAFKFNTASRQSAEVKEQHNKGCNCTQSSCVKNYCECYKAKMMCSSTCRCVGCLNVGVNSEMKTRVRGSPESHSNKNMHKEQYSPWLITRAVVVDIRSRLLAQAAQAEQGGCCPALAQRKILQEFGHSLTEMLESL